MEIPTVIIILLVAALLALICHRAVLSNYSDPVQTEREAAQRAREREQARKQRGASAGRAAAEKIGRALPLSQAAADEARSSLSRAGLKMDPSTWHGAELLCLAGLTLAGALLGLSAGGPAMLVFIALGAFLGFILPKLFLTARTNERRDAIDVSLPDTLDLLSISVRAGASVERAFKLVAQRTDGPLSEELAQVDRDINMFNFRNTEALERMAERCASRQVGEFCSALIQSIKQGSSISRVLQGQAKVARQIQIDRAEEKSNTIPTKVVLPMALAFVPATLLVGVAPQVASVLSFLGQLSF